MADRQNQDQQGAGGLGRNGAVPGNLPLFNSGWGAGDWDFEPGEALWEHVAGMRADGDLVANLDLAMDGRSSPRVWLILHEPGHPELSATAALTFARELAGRDQAVLVLDCDDQSQALTRWAGRLEAEGWIDLARYGTSVLTSGMAMPFGGRRSYLLGVGSFAPTDVNAEEIQQLVQRMRHQADDLILVAPADGIGELWAPFAGIRLLCWDRATRPAAEMEGLVASLGATGHGLTGLVGFGLPPVAPASTESELVDDVLRAAPTAPGQTVAADEIPGPVLDDRPEPEIPAPGEDEVDPIPPTDDFETPALAGDARETREASEDGWSEPYTDQDAEDDKEAGWTEGPAFDEPAPAGKDTSGVFWFVATALVVVVAIMGLYWFKYVRVPSAGHFQPVEVAADQGAPLRVPGDRSQGDMANQDDPPVTETVQAAVDSMAAPADSASFGTLVGTGSGSAGDADSVMVVEAAIESVAGDGGTAEAAGEQEPVAAEPVEIVAPAPSVPEAPVFTMAPYKSAVGAAGWALHLYSFPAVSGADVELAELKRRGFKTEVRVVETREKGRWWRIYVGSFASRAEAREAAPLLKKKLRTDWANPTRF